MNNSIIFLILIALAGCTIAGDGESVEFRREIVKARDGGSIFISWIHRNEGATVRNGTWLCIAEDEDGLNLDEPVMVFNDWIKVLPEIYVEKNIIHIDVSGFHENDIFIQRREVEGSGKYKIQFDRHDE